MGCKGIKWIWNSQNELKNRKCLGLKCPFFHLGWGFSSFEYGEKGPKPDCKIHC
jgi:hypothetical protein